MLCEFAAAVAAQLEQEERVVGDGHPVELADRDRASGEPERLSG